ncbi:uncharacterized protein LOC114349533 isoform X2 [Diabrotica virgifera virgifera]|uniref:Uncharacterized protein LOC114349533 isoform X1 n=1 Tax=Diabrotica virgifera virgifera TaxID=50390 RepID=A0A6P7H171_DIAVI|nr:uncharacterized protein LOC114349533 isoform X1 [Diabrotica virgifera virgifera]XP_050499091.1 uncharacterized protein LOC114349533 isoform X2 [Diabrotica virgifera virgifera]
MPSSIRMYVVSSAIHRTQINLFQKLTKNVPINRSGGKLVPPSAILLAGLGVGVSSFSLKQMLQSKRPKLL